MMSATERGEGGGQGRRPPPASSPMGGVRGAGLPRSAMEGGGRGQGRRPPPRHHTLLPATCTSRSLKSQSRAAKGLVPRTGQVTEPASCSFHEGTSAHVPPSELSTPGPKGGFMAWAGRCQPDSGTATWLAGPGPIWFSLPWATRPALGNGSSLGHL